MTIEEALAKLAINTGRIAEALEALVSDKGIVPDDTRLGVPTTDDSEPVKKKKKKVAKKKPVTKKKPATKKKTTKSKTVVGKSENEDEAESRLSLSKDVRPVLKRLRFEISSAAFKSLLKKYGASTVPDIDPKDYKRIVEDALRDLGEEEKEEDQETDDEDLFADEDY